MYSPVISSLKDSVNFEREQSERSHVSDTNRTTFGMQSGSSGQLFQSPAGNSKLENDSNFPLSEFSTVLPGTNRINVDAFMNKFQRQLGRKWERYRDSITKFVMVKETLKPREVSLHNFLFLSILANCCRELPPGHDSVLSGWKQAKGQTKKLADTPIELLHREILTLSAKERKRIKNIVKEAAKKPPVPVPPPVVVATRRAMLPKLPYQPDKTGKISNSAARSTNIQRAALPSSDGTTLDDMEAEHAEAAMQMTTGSPHHHAGRYSNPMMWTQDIIHSFDAPLASESFEIPSDTNLGMRMLGIALEHGVLRGIEVGTTDVMLRGLETYLISLITQMHESVLQKNPQLNRPLSVFDLDLYYEHHPAEFIELNAPLMRMRTTMLQDEETVLPDVDTQIQVEPIPEAQATVLADNDDTIMEIESDSLDADIAEIIACHDTYLELVSPNYPSRKRTAAEREAIEDSEKGQQLVLELLSS